MEGSRQALSRAGGGIWGCQSPSSILPPLQHRARTRTKRSGKANQLLLVPGTFSHSMGRAVSRSSPARRNGMCWKIWSTQETCKIKPQTIGSYQYLSKQKIRRGKKKKRSIQSHSKMPFQEFHLPHLMEFIHTWFYL